jgi:hypothetical protein
MVNIDANANRIPDRPSARAIHNAALAGGGKDNGASGPRSDRHNYYGGVRFP